VKERKLGRRAGALLQSNHRPQLGWLVATVAELTGDKDLTATKMMAENARAQVEAVRRGRPAQEEIRPNGPNLKSGGSSPEKLLRRLARSHRDVFDRYDQAEFKSVRAAANASR
jgi:hypothetical protein